MTGWTATGNRLRQTLQATQPVWPAALPPLDADERPLLVQWLKGSAQEPRWQGLLEAAGPARIELAHRLSDLAVRAGLCTRKERFEHGRWRPVALCWVELERLQGALGLPTRRAHDSRRAALADRLAALMADERVGEAAQALAESRMALGPAEARAALLDALAAWLADGAEGLRRDFALRLGHTKAVSPGEWQWLARHFDLPALGIGDFAPTLTLAGTASLVWAGDRRVDLAALHFATLPVPSLLTLRCVDHPPSRWRLVENRASFEKLAARQHQHPGDLLVWIAGRPTRAWAEAVARLLSLAPAPAAVSADADPAGIEIALAAAAPWEAASLPWAATDMEPSQLERASVLPLGPYDRGVLARLRARPLPPALDALRQALEDCGVKAEQEAWL